MTSVAFNSTGTILASGSEDKTIKLWNIETKTEIGNFLQKDHVAYVAFNNTGTILAYGSHNYTINL